MTITGSHVDGGGGQEPSGEWRNEWQISESVSTGSFFKALHRRGKNTATIKRKALIEAQNGGLF